MAVSIVNMALRGFQLLFAIFILGLSVSLIRDHHLGSLPATLGFAAFVSAIAVLGAFVGIAASFVSILEGPIGLVVDVAVALINAVGGILIAVKLKGASCKLDGGDNEDKLLHNDMVNGGHITYHGIYHIEITGGRLLTHCRSAQADMVFMFLTVVLLIVAALLTFLRMRKGH